MKRSQILDPGRSSFHLPPADEIDPNHDSQADRDRDPDLPRPPLCLLLGLHREGLSNDGLLRRHVSPPGILAVDIRKDRLDIFVVLKKIDQRVDLFQLRSRKLLRIV